MASVCTCHFQHPSGRVESWLDGLNPGERFEICNQVPATGWESWEQHVSTVASKRAHTSAQHLAPLKRCTTWGAADPPALAMTAFTWQPCAASSTCSQSPAGRGRSGGRRAAAGSASRTPRICPWTAARRKGELGTPGQLQDRCSNGAIELPCTRGDCKLDRRATGRRVSRTWWMVTMTVRLVRDTFLTDLRSAA